MINGSAAGLMGLLLLSLPFTLWFLFDSPHSTAAKVFGGLAIQSSYVVGTFLCLLIADRRLAAKNYKMAAWLSAIPFLHLPLAMVILAIIGAF